MSWVVRASDKKKDDQANYLLLSLLVTELLTRENWIPSKLPLILVLAIPSQPSHQAILPSNDGKRERSALRLSLCSLSSLSSPSLLSLSLFHRFLGAFMQRQVQGEPREQLGIPSSLRILLSIRYLTQEECRTSCYNSANCCWLASPEADYRIGFHFISHQRELSRVWCFRGFWSWRIQRSRGQRQSFKKLQKLAVYWSCLLISQVLMLLGPGNHPLQPTPSSWKPQKTFSIFSLEETPFSRVMSPGRPSIDRK